MNPEDREKCVARYQERLDAHGHSPLSLGWGDNPAREPTRFGLVLDLARETSTRSILDVGCGFGDLKRFLETNGWDGRYHGIDLVPGLVHAAQAIDPEIHAEVADLHDFNFESGHFDLVVCSGAFNHQLEHESTEQHVRSSIEKLYRLCTKAVIVDFMTSRVDFTHPDAWHTDPKWAVEEAMRHTGRFRLIHDYMPYEYSLVLFKDQTVDRGIFTGSAS